MYTHTNIKEIFPNSFCSCFRKEIRYIEHFVGTFTQCLVEASEGINRLDYNRDFLDVLSFSTIDYVLKQIDEKKHNIFISLDNSIISNDFAASKGYYKIPNIKDAKLFFDLPQYDSIEKIGIKHISELSNAIETTKKLLKSLKIDQERIENNLDFFTAYEQDISKSFYYQHDEKYKYAISPTNRNDKINLKEKILTRNKNLDLLVNYKQVSFLLKQAIETNQKWLNALEEEVFSWRQFFNYKTLN